MEPSLTLALVAMAGSAVFMAVGYLNEWAKNKVKCETVEFKVGYAVTTIFIMLAAGLYYLEQGATVASGQAILEALAMGLAGNAGLSKGISLVTNLNQSRQQINNIMEVVDKVGDAMTPETGTVTETPDNMAEVMKRAQEAGLIKE